jgi:glucose-6-phosphate 1-dehydrogenase
MDSPAPEPHVFVIFGATGDLVQRKLLGTLFRLHQQGKLPGRSAILGVARHAHTDDEFRATCEKSLLAESETGAGSEIRAYCTDRLTYYRLDDEGERAYSGLKQRLEAIEKERGLPGHRVFYLALPSPAFGPTLEGLGGAGLAASKGWTRVVIEKPFGRDLASAQALNSVAHRFFDEKQIYRIDHYLGKETVQNLLVFRFANAFVESDWNRDRIEQVEITVAESLGVEGRADYYDTSGALRDMIQNHVTQVLTLVAMEPPARRNEDDIRDEKVKVLRSALPLRPEDVVRGQYSAGTIDGKAVPGYRAEPGVTPESSTETYIALCVRLATWRWQNVPFFVRTGKRLPAKSSRVVVTFRAPPVSFFPNGADYAMNPDRVTILLQPEEGFEIAFEVKVPGREMRVQTHTMKFHYSDVFGPLPDGYDTLVEDVLLGDASLFVRADEVEESWRLYDPVLANPPPIVFYPAGSSGPAEAEKLVGAWGLRWSAE